MSVRGTRCLGLGYIFPNYELPPDSKYLFDDNGGCYQGQVYRGQRHGLGVHRDANDDTYYGTWCRGKFVKGDVEFDLDDCNYIRFFRGDGNPRWQGRKGVNGFWSNFEEEEIDERCAGANYYKKQEAMQPNVPYVHLSPTDGYVITSNKKLKNEYGLAIATYGGGQLRYCSAHAAYNVARNVRPELKGVRGASQNAFEKLLPGTFDPTDDPSIEDVQRVLGDFKVKTERLFNMSPHLLINIREGVLLVRLELWYDGQAEPGYHLTVYHAPSGAILDPDASDSKSTVVTDDDRVAHPANRKERADANIKAMRVFHATFPVPQKIRMLEVWRCDAICSSPCA